MKREKKHTSSKKMRRGWLSRKMIWWEKQVGSQLERKGIHIHVPVQRREKELNRGGRRTTKKEKRKAENDSKCDTYITRGLEDGGW